MRSRAQNKVFSVPVKKAGRTQRIKIQSGIHFLLLDIACVTPGQEDLYMDYPLPFSVEETFIEASEDFFDSIIWKAEADPVSGFMEEEFRQQVHFTPKRGWMNDPNGLYQKDGVWHLFFQHNPLNTSWGNMHWSHAESTDLIHWHETGIVLYPDEKGTIYSGGAFIDSQNAAGFGENAVLLYYTNCGYDGKGTQNLAYSTDGGKTYQKYEHNPLIPNLSGGCDRDPVVVYDPESDICRMVLYSGTESGEFLLFSSRDLLQWRQTDTYRIAGGCECPGLLRMKDKKTNRFLWVFWEANMYYRTGLISPGGKITFLSEPRRFLYGDAYAGQHFFQLDEQQAVFMAWLRMSSRPDSSYTGSMTCPVYLDLYDGELLVKPAYSFSGETASLCGRVDFSFPGRRTVLDLDEKELIMDDRIIQLPEELPGQLEGMMFKDRISVEFFEKSGRFAFALRTR